MRIKDRRKNNPKQVNPNSLANLKKTIPLNEREDFLEVSARGGKNSKQTKNELRRAKDILSSLLSVEYSEEDIDKILGDSKQYLDNKSAYTVLMAKMIQVANGGNVKASEFIRDTVGDKPTEDINLNANVITDKDRELLNILGKALNTGVSDTK